MGGVRVGTPLVLWPSWLGYRPITDNSRGTSCCLLGHKRSKGASLIEVTEKGSGTNRKSCVFHLIPTYAP